MTRRTLLSSLLSFFGPSVITLAQSAPDRQSHCGAVLTLLTFALPSYPPLARQLGIEGKSTSTIEIDSEGKVISVAKYSGHEAFESHVRDALKKWTFNAEDQSTARTLDIEIDFILKGKADERCLSCSASGTLPSHFEIEANPSTDLRS